ncbi:hypothetical protein FG135_18615 [Vibrio cholerae]|uniref:hypothetical protein n=1 Tax=Vibrio cholerae TaxID=666 RepID=UPI00085191A9|nr:hypothetical protein [Vibrio cholerae]EJL6880607.1 hypothetical protein [Vibrio cholerae]MBC9070258.1 hypothetical protein [Vibrio cholerae]MDA5323233.1 hypothetical protein [Vibrio cholerae]MDN6976203.1 hypothetical protein [Vibrio cholerae]MDN6987260.1 hypothetical protein [Vibrio cholerae]
MKKSLMVLTVMIALVGCDDATKAIDEAQAAANKAVDNLQQKADSLNLQDLNLDVLGDATQKAQEFTQSIDSLINTDFTDHQAVVVATEKISNSYSCLVDVSSEATAENLLDKIVSSVKNDQVLAIIEKGVAQAKTAKECVM